MQQKFREDHIIIQFIPDAIPDHMKPADEAESDMDLQDYLSAIDRDDDEE